MSNLLYGSFNEWDEEQQALQRARQQQGVNDISFGLLQSPNKYMQSPMHPAQLEEILARQPVASNGPAPMDMSMLALNPPVEFEFGDQPAMQALARRRMAGQQPARPFTPEELAAMLR